jgi:sugar phosphate isomerase/epimerase
MPTTRRTFLSSTAGAAAAAALAGPLAETLFAQPKGSNIGFGLVTYMWGADWDLPTLISNCEKSGVAGVELRTTHAHGVEPKLNEKEREAVKRRFADTSVVLVGLGSDERFDNPDPAKVKAAVAATKEFLRLSHDVGGSGVKVKPDSFQKDVPHEKTIEQIGKALNEVGEYAAGFGQQVRLEVHGGCAELPTIKAIMDIATDPNVAVCWNSNAQDLQGKGLEYNFNLVRKRFGATLHARELDTKDYPFPKLIELLVQTDYEGWILMEASSKPADRLAALKAQRKLFDELIKKAQG